MLTTRQRIVLFELIGIFMETGEPVSSAQLTRCEAITVSSATVRNVLGDLEKLELVKQPHTSAGRMPTPAGLRLYVDNLKYEEGVGANTSGQELRQAFGQLIGEDVESVARGVGGIVSGLVRMTSLLTLPVLEELKLEDLHLTRLSDRRVMAVLVTSDEQVHHRVVQLDQELDHESVRRMERYLSELSVGKSLREVHRDVLRERQSLTLQWEEWMQCALDVGEQVLQVERPSMVHVEGVFHMFDYAELTADMERLRRLMGVLEERERVLMLLDRLLEEPESPRAFIGPELGLELGDDFSLVVCGYAGAERGQGVIGVLGPSRMNYAYIMPLMHQAAHLFSAYLSR